MVKNFVAFFCFHFFFVVGCLGQNTTNSTQEPLPKMPSPTTTDTTPVHSPKKAALRSAIIPGWGQAYNKKYWKMPIIYAGLGTCVYFITTNQIEYNHLKKAYLLRIDDDPNTQDLRYATDIPNEVIYDYMETYRGYLEWSVIATVAIYALNIIDATVDAHLFTFDVSDDLSLRWQPTMQMAYNKWQPTLSLQLKF